MSTVSSNSAINGLYSNPNQITGLVSGLDTQGMIESLVESYSMKITSLGQDAQMAAWEQSAYRDAITMLSGFTSQYASFSNASTNLSSNAFFTNAVSSIPQGTYSSAVSTSGSTDSDIIINSISALATSSRYESSNLSDGPSDKVTAKEEIDVTEKVEVGLLKGDMKLSYGNTTVTLSFDSSDLAGLSSDSDSATQTAALAELINDKLRSTDVTINGTTGAAIDRMEAKVVNGEIVFEDQSSGKNSITVTSASLAIRNATGMDFSDGELKSIKLEDAKLVESQTVLQQMSGQDFNFTLDGVSRTVTMPSIVAKEDGTGFFIDGDLYNNDEAAGAFVDALNKELNNILGGNVKAENVATTDGNLQLQFNIANGDTSSFSMSSIVNESLGLDDTATNYLNSSATLGDLLDDYDTSKNTSDMLAIGGVSYTTVGGWKDSQGNLVEDKNGQWVRVDENGNTLKGQEIVINGESIGVFNEDSSLNEVLSAINTSDAGVKASISTLTGKVIFTTTDTGANTKIDITGGLAEQLFGETVATSQTTTTYKGEISEEDYSSLIASAATDTEDETFVADAISVTIDGTEYKNTQGQTMDDFLASLPVTMTAEQDENGKYSFSLSTTDGEEVTMKIGDTQVIGEYESDIEAFKGNLETWDGYDSSTGKIAAGTYTIVDANGDFEEIEIDNDVPFETFQELLNGASGGDYYVEGTADNFYISMKEGGAPIQGFLAGTIADFTVGGEFSMDNAAEGQQLGSFETLVRYAGSKEEVTENTYGSGYTSGTDAEMSVTVNGENMTIVRSNNDITIDGLKITLSEVFEPEEGEDGISFKTEHNTDDVVDVVKQMVSDYNDMIAFVRDLYTTVPNQDSTGSTYKPLTDEDRADMSESEIEKYEEKAQTGILFGDSNMRSLYESLTGIFSGTLGAELRSIGIDTTFSFEDKATTLTLDEDKLAEMLRNDPTKVQDIFTRSTETGASSDGLMATLSNKIDNYASIQGTDKGILVRAAGTELSSLTLLDNFYQDQIDSFQAQIDSWQSKLSDKVTYYTNQFTRLEVLMSQMNSQSSALAGLSTSY